MSKELSLSEFRAIVKEEAEKLKKRIVLESEKKALIAEMETLSSPQGEESTMDEAAMEEIFGSGKRREARLKADFVKYSNIWKKKGAIRGMNQEMLDELMQQAAADDFQGKPGIDGATKLMMYKKGADVNWAGSGNPQGGGFAG